MKRVLVVEDEASIREMVALNLKMAGWEVVEAPSAERALELMHSGEHCDAALLDIMLPGMDGLSLCETIRRGDSDIGIIIVSAKGQESDKIRGLSIGADDYITKPFNTNLLISRCNNLVNSRRLLQEKFSKQPQAFAQMLATNPMDKEMLDRAMAIIEQHLDNTDFNVNIFAREMGMARTNLFTKLKAVTGQTPNDFILSIRLKKGAVMLRNNPELNITEISDRIGFSSSRYFSKCFKEIYHVSPLAYRKGEEKEEEGNEETDQ